MFRYFSCPTICEPIRELIVIRSRDRKHQPHQTFINFIVYDNCNHESIMRFELTKLNRRLGSLTNAIVDIATCYNLRCRRKECRVKCLRGWNSCALKINCSLCDYVINIVKKRNTIARIFWNRQSPK